MTSNKYYFFCTNTSSCRGYPDNFKKTESVTSETSKRKEVQVLLTKMSHFKEVPYFSGIGLLNVNNVVSMPQDVFTPHNMVGVDSDGNTVRMFDLNTELEGKYFVLLFFPMDLTVDSEEVLSFKASLESFEAEGCKVTIKLYSSRRNISNITKVIGVTADSPLTTSRWIRFNFFIHWTTFGPRSNHNYIYRKRVSDGGFGGAPGFPILSDRSLAFSSSCGVAR